MKKTPELYDKENEARKEIEFWSRKLPDVKVWQIWWYYVWVNIWQEISKSEPHQRQCLVFREIKDSSLLLIIPLSTKLHKKRKTTSFEIKNWSKFGLKRTSRLLLHQIQVVDKKRLQNRIWWKSFGKRFIRLLNHELFE